MGVALTQALSPNSPPSLITVGGWGYPSTDSGSGFSIAVKGITAAFDAFDGVAEPTALCEKVLSHFDCRRPRELIDRFNNGSVTKSRLASFAVEVSACAQQGDAVAQAILEQAAHRLSRYGLSLLKHLPEGGRRLGLFGSVLTKNQALRQGVIAQIRARYPDAQIELPSMPPEWGAAQYALHCIGGAQ